MPTSSSSCWDLAWSCTGPGVGEGARIWSKYTLWMLPRLWVCMCPKPVVSGRRWFLGVTHPDWLIELQLGDSYDSFSLLVACIIPSSTMNARPGGANLLAGYQPRLKVFDQIICEDFTLDCWDCSVLDIGRQSSHSGYFWKWKKKKSKDKRRRRKSSWIM